MSIYKDNVTGKWRVVYRYTDWTGKTKQTSKRGFPTKREAQMWEHEQMLKHDAKLDMTFASFYEIYVEDKKERIRDNTWGTKNNIARTKILPYFGERKIGLHGRIICLHLRERMEKGILLHICGKSTAS